MNFEYDPEKSKTNRIKHGITLEQAKSLWSSPGVKIEAKTVGEPRFMLIGKIDRTFYSCIYTSRGHTIRLISARRSRKNEEELYHEKINT